jgi:hypothetical protein
MFNGFFQLGPDGAYGGPHFLLIAYSVFSEYLFILAFDSSWMVSALAWYVSIKEARVRQMASNFRYWPVSWFQPSGNFFFYFPYTCFSLGLVCSYLP